MKEIHLIPDTESDEDHTVGDCYCRPLVLLLRTKDLPGWKERVVFHREVGRKK